MLLPLFDQTKLIQSHLPLKKLNMVIISRGFMRLRVFLHFFPVSEMHITRGPKLFASRT